MRLVDPLRGAHGVVKCGDGEITYIDGERELDGIIRAAIGGIIVAIGLIVTGIYRIKRYRVKRSLAVETPGLGKQKV